jgi:hypothetical protein
MRLFFATALLVAMGASSASASIFGSFIRQGAPGSPIVNMVEDNDAEVINKGAGNVAAEFEVGDSVSLYLQMETITSGDGFFLGTDLTDPTAGGATYRMLAKGTFTITSITPTTPGNGDIQFNGSIDFAERNDGVGYKFTDGIAAANTVFAAATYLMTAGVGKASDFITATNAPLSFAAIPLVTGSAFVNADFGLSLTGGGGDLGLVPNYLPGTLNGTPTGTFHTFVGSTQTKSALNATNVPGGGDNKFDLTTNTNLNMAATVPEPGSLAVFAGLALCGGLRTLRARRMSKN